MSQNPVSGVRGVVLGLDQARLCPDCDFLTDARICPVCGREQTWALSDWIPPLAAWGSRTRDTDTPIWGM